jgi:hypothetical protein
MHGHWVYDVGVVVFMGAVIGAAELWIRWRERRVERAKASADDGGGGTIPE